MAQSVRSVLSAWEDYRLVADEYRELDAERVLVLHHRRGRGKTSGLEVAELGREGAQVFHVRNGVVRRLVGYKDRDRALADLGLEG